MTRVEGRKQGSISNTAAGQAIATVRPLCRLRIRGRPRHVDCSSVAHTAPLWGTGANASGRLRCSSLVGLWLAIPPGYATAVGPASGDDRVHRLLRDVVMGLTAEPVMEWTAPPGFGLLSIQERLEALGGTLQIMLPAAASDPVADGSCCGTS